MNAALEAIGAVLGFLMRGCYTLCSDYGTSILLFTLLMKILLLPLSLMMHRSSLTVVRMQPEVNRLRIAHFGDPDGQSEALAALYRRNRYNPLVSLIPLAVQLLLLMGVIQVIYHPLTYLLGVDRALLEAWFAAAAPRGLDAAASGAELTLLGFVRSGQGAALAAELSPEAAALLPALQGFDTGFLGLDLGAAAAALPLPYLGIPLAAGASALLLSLCQDRLNPLQREQSRAARLGTGAFSVGLSLYLGYFVPAGVALYWVAANLLTIVQQLLLNRLMDPRKAVDYAALEQTRRELDALNALDGEKDSALARAHRRREKADMKRFFSVEGKHLVFYAESQGFYKYLGPVMDEILRRSNLTVHYVTSDHEDAVFALAERQPRLRAYYVGPRKLITLMMKMDADVVVMTLTDLDNYHYKRSYVRKDTRYVYLFHYPLSTHMVLHTGALDHYDHILCVGDFQVPEIRRAEEIYGLPPKRLTVCGYCQLDSLYKAYAAMPAQPHAQPRILVAPSWQQDNLLDSCLEPLLNSLLERGWAVTLRPHPEYVKRYPARWEAVCRAWEGRANLTLESDFTSNASIYGADLTVTDWSGTATEFAFVTLRPCLFIHTPPKVNNPDYERLGIPPQELLLRTRIGVDLPLEEAGRAGEAAAALLAESDAWRQRILDIRTELIAHFPDSAPYSARAILEEVVAQQARRRANGAAASSPKAG